MVNRIQKELHREVAVNNKYDYRFSFWAKQVCLLLFCASIATTAFPSLVFSAEPPKVQATELQKKIEKRESEINRIRQQRQQYEQQASLHNSKIHQYDVQFQRYLANLENSEERVKGMETDLLALLEQKERRDAFIEVACRLAGESAHEQNGRFREIAIQVVADLYRQETEEKPKREELEKKIEKELAYQKRIREHYMVNDQIQRERIEERLASSQTQAEENEHAEQQIASELKSLRESLQNLEDKLSRIREKTQKAPASSTPQQAPFQAGRPFGELRGNLPWPAPGTLVRQYGPFTHPTLKVKLDSKGIDVAVDVGTPLKAVADGRVLYAGMLEQYGSIVAVDHGDGYLTIYGNVETKSAKPGHVFKAGETVGLVGKRNGKDKPVYHFEIRRGDKALNPAGWLAR